MTKRAFPLLYIYQKKEAEVDPPSQEFVYTKYDELEQDNDVDGDLMEGEHYSVDLSGINNASLESLLKEQSKEKKQVELQVADAMYVGTISLEGDLVFCQVDPSSNERISFSIKEIQSAKIKE
ncbi:hypothetical protein [Bacillus sp. JCM 19034]|uniref:hypothetical protein n=1 Tax=Bacillus sp. JCM 19034 TaxID=1481928 RepID=UPI000782EF11|nr:hypothetical protein [Bacillus sp. JCM 19034]